MRHRFFLLITAAAIVVLSGARPAAAGPSTPNVGTAQAVAVGSGFGCAIVTGGGVKCWGVNDVGQLGDGTYTSRTSPVDVVGLSGVTKISAGQRHVCVVASGGVKCWGYLGTAEEGGQDRFTTPVDVTGLTSGVAAVAAGWGFTCALTTTGGVKCWGSNSDAALGDGTYIDHYTPAAVSGLAAGVLAIAAGATHACAVLATNHVKCWGDNTYGQIGDDSTTDATTPEDVLWVSTATAVTAGIRHTCALMANDVRCWGDNAFGELGDFSTTSSKTAVSVFGISSSTAAIASGSYHTCAFGTYGDVECWGLNNAGQLGDGTTTNRTTPTSTAPTVRATSLGSANAGTTTCVVTRDGTVNCWGDNVQDQLLDPTPMSRATPVAVSGMTNATSLISSRSGYTCVALSSGGVRCWGDNASGQLGDGTSTTSGTPRAVSGVGGTVLSLSAGGDFACAVTFAGGTACWGGRVVPRAGNESLIRNVPFNVPTFASGIAAVAAGADHVCVLTNLGGVNCWGSNFYGQLGDGSGNSYTSFVNVVGLTSGVTAIAAGARHTCAVVSGGVRCWGMNWYGQVGNSTTTDQPTPVPVYGLDSGVASVAAGERHTCALMTSGAVKCWGSDWHGEVGTGTWTGYSSRPKDVLGFNVGVTSVAVGDGFTCAVRDAAAWCWGANPSGQLGDGSTLDRYSPVQVAGAGSGILRVSAGGTHACAVKNDGRVVCWGADTKGQLGDGRVVSSPTAIDVGGFDRQPATVYLAGLDQTHDGWQKSAGVTTSPWGLTTAVTYTGVNGTVYGPTITAPTAAGSYRVLAVVSDSGYIGWNTGVMRIRQYASPTFTDAALQTRSTAVRAVHVVELRQGIDRLRAFVGLNAFPWTDTSVTARSSTIKAAHVTDLRAALASTYAAQGLTAPTWTPATVTARSTVITAAQIAALRSALVAAW